MWDSDEDSCSNYHLQRACSKVFPGAMPNELQTNERITISHATTTDSTPKLNHGYKIQHS